jgi:hypothetical protein
MNYFFHPKARVEHLEHVAYYESRQKGLGARYLAAFNAAMTKVCASPHRYKIEFLPDIRRYRVPGFPFNILYRQEDKDVEVLVVASHRRRPDYWIDRV